MSDLSTFLKQNSTIPDAFIDSFLTMYNPETVQTDFAVDLDNAANWLRLKKYTLMKTLRESYTLNVDYKVSKAIMEKRYGGNNYKKVLLTPDCFKRLCMRSRSKRAEEVRTYFIMLESLLVKYRTTLIKGINAEIKDMQKSMKPKSKEDSAGYIYVIKASTTKDSVYKIGRTQDLNKRLATYQTGSLEGVELVYKFRTNSHKKTEACVKLMLKERQLRKYKEVYEAEIDFIKSIIQQCDDTVTYTRLYTDTRAAKKVDGGYYLVLAEDS